MSTAETTISQGRLRGHRDSGVDAYFAIPYAAPPARFRPPEAPPPWDGTRDATRTGPASPQPRSRLAHVMGDRSLEQSEDCLTLNVWTPSDPGEGGRPVLVFLHGGGFSSGSGALDWYAGGPLARRGDLVVVTVNYRLGALGFMQLEHGNVGVLDQIQALRWVRDNIAAFGGDPDAVTVSGQSAGAISILAMLSGQAADGLFQRAILQSAPAGMRPQTPAEADELAAEFVDILGTDPYEAAVSDLLTTQLELARRHPNGAIPPFQLVGDGHTVAADIITTVGEHGVPILMGTTRDEARAFMTDGDAEVTESLFAGPMMRLAAQSTPAWLYRFDWSPAGSPLRACHCIELPFVFGTLPAYHDAPMLAGADITTLTALVDVVQPAWISFVHHGDPGWPASAVQLLGGAS